VGFDYETLKYIHQHREWLGFLQPVELVVSPPALVNQGVYLDRAIAIEYQQLLSSLPTPDFEPFAEKILEWIPDQD